MGKKSKVLQPTTLQHKAKSTLILQFALDCSERSFPRKGGGPVGPYKGGRPYGAFQVGKVLWGLPL